MENKEKTNSSFQELIKYDISGVITPAQKKEQILFEMLRTTIGLLDKNDCYKKFIDAKTTEWSICTHEESKPTNQQRRVCNE